MTKLLAYQHFKSLGRQKLQPIREQGELEEQGLAIVTGNFFLAIEYLRSASVSLYRPTMHWLCARLLLYILCIGSHFQLKLSENVLKWNPS
jgi:hypothetical protein